MRAAAFLALALAACGPDMPDPVETQAHPEGSIFRLQADLVNQAGAQHDLSVHQGHPTLMSMIYTTCPTACPMLINDIKLLEDDSVEAEEKDRKYDGIEVISRPAEIGKKAPAPKSQQDNNKGFRV